MNKINEELKLFIKYIESKNNRGYIIDGDLDTVWQNSNESFEAFTERYDVPMPSRISTVETYPLDRRTYLKVIPLRTKNIFLGYYFYVEPAEELDVSDSKLSYRYLCRFEDELYDMLSYSFGSTDADDRRQMPTALSERRLYVSDIYNNLDMIVSLFHLNAKRNVFDISEYISSLAKYINVLCENENVFKCRFAIEQGLFARVNKYLFQYAIINMALFVYKTIGAENKEIELKAHCLGNDKITISMFTERAALVPKTLSELKNSVDSDFDINNDNFEIAALSVFANMCDAELQLYAYGAGGLRVDIRLSYHLPERISSFSSMKNPLNSADPIKEAERDTDGLGVEHGLELLRTRIAGLLYES